MEMTRLASVSDDTDTVERRTAPQHLDPQPPRLTSPATSNSLRTAIVLPHRSTVNPSWVRTPRSPLTDSYSTAQQELTPTRHCQRLHRVLASGAQRSSRSTWLKGRREERSCRSSA